MHHNGEKHTSFSKCEEDLLSLIAGIQAEADEFDLKVSTILEENQQQIDYLLRKAENSSNEGDVANACWPVGTESWHIHEVKPQREVFTRSIFSDLTLMTQYRHIELQSEIITAEKLSNFHTGSLLDETVCQVGEVNDLRFQYIMKPCEQLKSVEKNSQNASKSIQPLSAAPLVNVQQQRGLQLLERTNARRRPKLQYNRLEPSQKPRLNDLVPASPLAIRFQSS